MWYEQTCHPAPAGWLLPLVAIDAGLAFLLWQVALTARAFFGAIPASDLSWLTGTGYWENVAAFMQPAVLAVVAAGFAVFAVPAMSRGSRLHQVAAVGHGWLVTLVCLAAEIQVVALLYRWGATSSRVIAAVGASGVLLVVVAALTLAVNRLVHDRPSVQQSGSPPGG